MIETTVELMSISTHVQFCKQTQTISDPKSKRDSRHIN